MKRRNFLSGIGLAAAGLWLPHKPERVYSFASPTAGLLDYWAWDVEVDGKHLGRFKNEIPMRFQDGKYHRVKVCKDMSSCEWQFKMPYAEADGEVDYMHFEHIFPNSRWVSMVNMPQELPAVMRPPDLVVRTDRFLMRLSTDGAEICGKGRMGFPLTPPAHPFLLT